MNEEIFLRKPCKIILCIYQHPGIIAYEIAKCVNMTHAYVYELIQKLEKAGFLKKENSGRKKKIFLTSEGEFVAQQILKIKEILGGKK